MNQRVDSSDGPVSRERTAASVDTRSVVPQVHQSGQQAEFVGPAMTWDQVDETSWESFPASDPPAWVR
jgi:hypothetical protein